MAEGAGDRGIAATQATCEDKCERHWLGEARVIPVILGPCYWLDPSWHASIAANRTNGKYPSNWVVHVEARGMNRHYTVTTNSKGEFEIKEPTCHYVVRAIKAGCSFETAESRYENANKVGIEFGGRALIQIAETSQPPR